AGQVAGEGSILVILAHEKRPAKYILLEGHGAVAGQPADGLIPAAAQIDDGGAVDDERAEVADPADDEVQRAADKRDVSFAGVEANYGGWVYRCDELVAVLGCGVNGETLDVRPDGTSKGPEVPAGDRNGGCEGNNVGTRVVVRNAASSDQRDIAKAA